ncbi:MAG: hydroxymethylbilane synthase [Dehalococcoidia bacterium]
MTRLRLGTRGSSLALVQSETVASLLTGQYPGLEVELVEIATAGDRDRTTPLAEGRGWFTTAIQEALQRGEIDLAVHSYKDLPTERPEGLVIAAVPLRADPRDALVSRDGRRLRDLPSGAVIGTSSPRREVQLRAMRPGLEVRPIRGNVETRIAKVRRGEYDATVLALAGLERLGRAEEAAEVFGIDEMLPAPAQGVLAVECREGDVTTREIVASIDDEDLRALVSAERSFLATLGAGCSFPAAAYAERFGTTVKLHGLIAPAGAIVRSRIGGAAATAAGIGRALALELCELAGIAPGH